LNPNDVQVQIQTMTDQHLETFIRCPQRFYYQFLLKERGRAHITWEESLQQLINKVVHRFFLLPRHKRNNHQLMMLIHEHAKNLSHHAFESKVHYVTALAKITDHLLAFLKQDFMNTEPIILYEKWSTYIEEVKARVSILFEVVEGKDEAFVIKKFVTSFDESLTKLFDHLMTVFSLEAFHKLPERIEVYSLLNGRKHVYRPCEADVATGYDYLQLLKESVEYPAGYMKADDQCEQCPFQKKCEKVQVERPFYH